MTLHPLTPDSLEERNRRGILFRRLHDCANCGAPKYDNAPERIRFVPPRRSRWAPI